MELYRLFNGLGFCGYNLCSSCFRGNVNDKSGKKKSLLQVVDNCKKAVSSQRVPNTLVKKKQDFNDCNIGISEYEKINIRSREDNRAMLIKMGFITPVEKKVRLKKPKKSVVTEVLRKSKRLAAQAEPSAV